MLSFAIQSQCYRIISWHISTLPCHTSTNAVRHFYKKIESNSRINVTPFTRQQKSNAISCNKVQFTWFAVLIKLFNDFLLLDDVTEHFLAKLYSVLNKSRNIVVLVSIYDVVKQSDYALVVRLAKRDEIVCAKVWVRNTCEKFPIPETCPAVRFMWQLFLLGSIWTATSS